MGNILKTIVVGFLAGLLGAGAFYYYQQQSSTQAESLANYTVDYKTDPTFKPAGPSSGAASFPPVDFSEGAAKAIPSVVYINSISQSGGIIQPCSATNGGPIKA